MTGHAELPPLLVITRRPSALLPRLRAAGVAGRVRPLTVALREPAPLLLDTVGWPVPALLDVLVPLARAPRAGAPRPHRFALLAPADGCGRQLVDWCAPITLQIADAPTLPPLAPWVRLPWRPGGADAVRLGLDPPGVVVPPALRHHILPILRALPQHRTLPEVAAHTGIAPATLRRVLAALRQALGLVAGRERHFAPPHLAALLLAGLADAVGAGGCGRHTDPIERPALAGEGRDTDGCD